jgi:phosphotransferase system HPr (HPr) family protein
MPDTPSQALEHVIEEGRFLPILNEACADTAALVRILVGMSSDIWRKQHYYQLRARFDTLENLLDDFGAKDNQTFHFLRELTASIRGFAQAGCSLAHMAGRLESYGVLDCLELKEYGELEGHVANARSFIQGSVVRMLLGLTEEWNALGVVPERRSLEEDAFSVPIVRQRLPHNLGESAPTKEVDYQAEIASKFIQAERMLREQGIRRIEDPKDRDSYLRRHVREEQARVFEATVHNLQSAYDTYIKRGHLRDPRLPQLRGLASTALHMLEAVTALTHFYERHESQVDGTAGQKRLNGLVKREDVQDRTLNHLLVPICMVFDRGSKLAREVLGAYTNAQELSVRLDDGVTLHARPAALIVGIVTRYGTPVELEVRGQRCNAGSILELLVLVGSNSDERDFTFRGDEKPLKDIATLFQYGLGEKGLDRLPETLEYLVKN